MKMQVSFNELFDATVEEILANRKVVLVNLALSVPVFSVWLIVFEAWSANPAAMFEATPRNLAAGVALLIFILLTGVIQYWLDLAMLRRSFHSDFSLLLPCLGISLLCLLGSGIGLVLFVIPGLILATRWTLVIPLVLARDAPPMETFSESWQRTSGSGWPIFAVIAMSFVVTVMISTIGSMIFEPAGEAGRIPGALFEALVSQVGAIASTAISVGAYRLLGPRHRMIEDVFG